MTILAARPGTIQARPIRIGLVLVAFALHGAPGLTQADEPDGEEQGVRAVQRGLEFLISDAARWREDRECSTCHHGTMTVWGLTEARLHGYSIDDEVYSSTVKWTKDRLLERIDLPRDTRPGWSMVNSSAICLAVMAACSPEQNALSADELSRISAHLLRHQEVDGSWAWSSAPAKNRPPPFFESDEVATLLTCWALRVQAQDNQPEDICTAVGRAEEWLSRTEPTDTTQAVALRWLTDVLRRKTSESSQPDFSPLTARQNPDGGWGQLPAAASDAYATGQALYVLSLAGAPRDSLAIRRGVGFLVRTQLEDGSWPMTRRGHPGVTPSDFDVPIIYFGTAWGTIGLVRAVPHGDSTP